MLEFQAFNKIARLSRDTIITEKIDNVSLINVGVDVNNFRPIKFLEALGKLKYAN